MSKNFNYNELDINFLKGALADSELSKQKINKILFLIERKDQKRYSTKNKRRDSQKTLRKYRIGW